MTTNVNAIVIIMMTAKFFSGLTNDPRVIFIQTLGDRGIKER